MTLNPANLNSASADGAGTSTINDVIGNRADKSFNTSVPVNGPTLVGHLKAGYYHIHSHAEIYPVLANAVEIAASADAWTGYGAWVEIIGANVINTAFDIHWINLFDISATGQYVLQLGTGAAESETPIGTVSFGRSSNFSAETAIPIQVAPIPKNTRVVARLSSSNAAADTVDIKVYYHRYPDVA